MAISPGTTLRKLRARRPLVHQITNYVVMNETANATLALGALPVMAHAPQEVEEMAANAGALVLNIGTLSEHWIEAMLLAGKAAKGPIVLDPVGAGATRYRTETAKRLLDELEVTVVRGNSAEIATLAGQAAEIRGVEAIGTVASTAELVRDAARSRDDRLDDRPDRPRLGRRAYRRHLERPRAPRHRQRHRLHVHGGHGLVPRRQANEPLEAAAEALVAFGVAGEDAARNAHGPGTFHAGLYDALYNLDPDTLDGRAKVTE